MEPISMEMERVDCADCSMVCFFPKSFVDARRRDHTNFRCGAGHAMHFSDPLKNETKESLKKQIDELKQQVQELRTEKAQLLHKLEQAGVS